MLTKIRDAHRFFIKETPRFIGTDIEYDWVNYGQSYNSGHYKLTFKQKLYYPIAYIRFMYYMLIK